MTKIRNSMCFSLLLAVTAPTGIAHARNIPHAELVKKHLQGGYYKQVVSNCKGPRMTAPAADAGQETECWAAFTASELEKQRQAIRALVLSDGPREATLSRCRALNVEQRYKSKECEAAIRADTFISLRLPRAVSTLKPVKFD
jgi:hypothetical protein